jgi:hypothetical protein
MDLSSIALEGLQQADAQLNQAAVRLAEAGGAFAGFPPEVSAATRSVNWPPQYEGAVRGP